MYALDSRTNNDGTPRTISVGTNMAIDYISAAEEGDTIFIESNVIKIGKNSALMDVNIFN